MTTVRRVYVYLVAFVSLLMLAGGLSGLAQTLVQAAVDPALATTASGFRGEVAQQGALVLVGLPVWLLHWLMAGRAADRDPHERAATLRRLYLYAALVAAIAALAGGLQDALESVFRLLLPAAAPGAGTLLASSVPQIVVAAAFWLYHSRVAATDRRLVGERDGSATLRRWYVYGVAFVALMYLLANAASVLRLTWETVAGLFDAATVTQQATGFPGPAATTLVALLLWVAHWSLWAVRGPAPLRRGSAAAPPAAQQSNAGPAAMDGSEAAMDGSDGSDLPDGPDTDVEAQDARSVLRPVYLFLSLGVAVAMTLTAAAQMLFYALGRLLGVAQPGGVGGSLIMAMAGPVSTLVVYGAGWLYHRSALAAQSRAQDELPRQAGVRRLYVYLVALVALAVLSTGAGGVLWTIADLATNAPRTINPDTWWREQISLYVTLLAVGLPVWLLHWGPVAAKRDVAEARSLARRIYLYLTLLAGVLALLGAGAVAAKQLLDLALGATATASAVTNLARAFSVAIVAAVVVVYHQRVLRADAAVAATAESTPIETSADAGTASAIPSNSLPDEALPYGVVYRQGTTDHAVWFATLEEAGAARATLDEHPDTRWAVLVRREDAWQRDPPNPSESAS